MTGLYLSLFAFALVFATGLRWFVLVYAVALPKNRAGFIVSMIVGAGLGVAAFVQGVNVLGGLLAGLAVFLGLMFVFTSSISAQKGGSGKLQPGAKMPSFTAPDHEGKHFEIASLDGRPILLKFFRGHW
jgi:hypothetical protein